MQIRMATLETCAEATGAVVAVDVLRAFTTAAYAFAAGAREIWLVGTVEEAFAMRKVHPDVLLMGEVDGVQVEGFDLGNSPAALTGMDLTGRVLVHRTTAGTQGVVRSQQAGLLLGASFACARATVDYLRARRPASVTFVVTGANRRRDGDEDRACAEYLAALLRDDVVDPGPYLQRVRRSTVGQQFASGQHRHFPAADLQLATDLDRFDAALPVHRRDGRWVMTAA